MFEIERNEDGALRLVGRLDASEAARASAMLEAVSGPTVVDMAKLTYISSMGLGLLLKTQKRLQRNGGGLKLVGVGKHLQDVFRFSGFHHVFEIETAD